VADSDVVAVGLALDGLKEWEGPYPPRFRFQVEQCVKGERSGIIEVTWYAPDDELGDLSYYLVYDGRRYLLCLSEFESGLAPTRGCWSVFEIKEDRRLSTWSGHDLGDYADWLLKK